MKKEKNNYLNKKILMNNKLIITLISIILIIIIPTSLSKTIKARSLLFTNEITLIINGIGNLTIISNINLIPSLIYINNEENPLEGSKVIYNIDTSPTTVKLVYQSNLFTCSDMFNGLNNILEINFSKFDFSQVTDMSNMFHSCNSLTSIDFSGINTQSLNNLNFVFYECFSLQNLDLSSFDTSSVTTMFQTFFGCHSLESVNLSSFDTSLVTTMFQTFFQCHNLKSLDLSNFNTSSVTTMFQMFLQNYNLENINISSFNTKSVTTMQEMFSGCTSLKSLDLGNFDTSSVDNTYQMFFDCKALTSLNLSSFNTKKINNMAEMFHQCENLEIIDISSFETSNTENMGNLFNGCKKLQSLNLSHFNTTKAKYIDNMFNGCNNLEILDISNFDTSSALTLANMFLDCQKLKSLDLSHFDTSKVNNMASMFLNCYALTSLELGNFNTSLVTDMSQMFYGCRSLISLNLNSFNTDNVVNYNDMFANLNTAIKYCINGEIIKEEMKNYFSSHSYAQTNCSELCYDNSQKKYIPDKNICINNCYNDDIYIYEYNNICYESCPNDVYYNYDHISCIDYIPLGYYLNDTNNRTLGKCNNKCSNCSKENELNDLCISCNNNEGYYKKFNDSNNNDLFVSCYKEDEIGFGYYLDTYNKIFNHCYETCKACTDKGNNENNLCTDCYTNYTLIDNNCLIIPETTEIIGTTVITEIVETTQIIETPETTKNIESTETTVLTESPETTQITEIHETTKNIESTEIALTQTPESTQIFEEPDKTIIIESSTITQITNEALITKNSDILNIDSNINSYSYEINSDSKNLKDKYKNVTYINFMEKDLDFIYQIFNLNKETDKIFIIVNDYKSNNSQQATSDYNYKFILENKTELNLSSINEDYYIDFYVPIKNLDLANFNYSEYFSDQGFDIYNKSSDFYNEFCTPAFHGENDITLKDRKKYIYPNNVTLCEKSCSYNGVDIENERVICSCNLNQNNSYEDTNKEDDFLVEDNGNFITYFLDNVNYNVFKCFNLLSSFNNLKDNYAFYTVLGVFLLIIILNFFFVFYTLPKMKKLMITEMPTKKKLLKATKEELIKIRKNSQKYLYNPIKKSNKSKKRKIKKKKTYSTNNLITNKKKKIFKKRSLSKKSFIKKRNFFLKTNNNNNNEHMSPSIERLIAKEKGEYLEKQFNNDEINDLPYTQAIKVDKRSIFQIFYSIIIQKLELINLFCGKEKFKIILVNEYILSLLFNFFINALLYSDEIVSKKYHNNGELDIIVTLFLSLLSNIVTSIILYYVKYSKGIEERYGLIMEIKIKKYYLKNIHIFFKYLKLKFICFFFSEVIIISCCYYYIVIFCIVYSKSKGSLMVNYLTSLLEGLITSFAITIIILVTRKIGINCSNHYFYNTSKYINNKF